MSVENLAYKLECIVYLFHLIIENMHFYPLDTTSKVLFWVFWFGFALHCHPRLWKSHHFIYRVSRHMATHFPVICGPYFL